jgi:hypothetical protein
MKTRTHIAIKSNPRRTIKFTLVESAKPGLRPSSIGAILNVRNVEFKYWVG